jgi:hypothetical protein
MKVLEVFERLWAREEQRRPGLPGFRRLWGLAEHQNRSRGNRLAEDDLLDVFMDAALYCLTRFDESHPPNQGLCRRTPADRFTYFFGRKVAWEMRTALRLRRRKHRRDRGRYRGPRADRYENAPQPRSKTPLLQMVHRNLGHVDTGDADLLRRRFWEGQTWKVIARECGFTNRFQARRRVRHAEARMRALLEGELQDALVHAQDDFDVVRAVLAA